MSSLLYKSGSNEINKKLNGPNTFADDIVNDNERNYVNVIQMVRLHVC